MKTSGLDIAQGWRGGAKHPLNQDPGILVLVLTLPLTIWALNCPIWENGANDAVAFDLMSNEIGERCLTFEVSYACDHHDLSLPPPCVGMILWRRC